MGDMADYFLEEVEDFECRRLDYKSGRISDEEAYDRGIIDEMGYEYIPGVSTGKAGSLDNQSKTCRSCGTARLHWGKHKGKWRLFDLHGLHQCKVNPLMG